MFTIKSFLQITASMIANMRAGQRQVTDFSVGSVNRTLLEAPAAELDELYQSYAGGLVEAIPTMLYRSFAFDLLPAMPAYGVVALSDPSNQAGPVSIPAGTIVSNPATGLQYRTSVAVVLPVGGTISVLASCTTAGASTNCAAGAISAVASSGLSVTVANPGAFITGTDAETPDQRALRFAAYVKTLARGTIGSIIYAVGELQITDPTTGMVVERVVTVAVDESPGYVACYAWNGTAAMSPALQTLIQQTIDGYTDAGGNLVPGYRPEGMRCDGIAATEQPVPVSISVDVPAALQTPATQAAVAAAMSAPIGAVTPGGTLSPLALQLGALTVPGVTLAQINSPTALVSCPLSAVLVPGAITVSWL